MTVKLPIHPLIKPRALRGVENGKLPESMLVSCGIGSFKMLEPAARSMRALVAAATAAGFKVSATGTYRSYDSQERLFRARYTLTQLPGRPTKTWQGKTWWQQPKTAMAAVPGTSNHGWGLAVDLAERGPKGVVSVSAKFVRWLIENAATFGYSAELQSEPWHWRYVAGDDIPGAVLKYEQGLQQDKPPVEEPDAGADELAALVEAIRKARTFVLRRGSGISSSVPGERDAVRCAQVLLQAHGYLTNSKIDGQFGPTTEREVIRFQKANGLTADGVIGPKTWSALSRRAAR